MPSDIFGLAWSGSGLKSTQLAYLKAGALGAL